MRRPLAALAAFLLLAIVGPATWILTRPSSQAGPPVDTIGAPAPTAASSAPRRTPSSAVGASTAPTAVPAPTPTPPVRLRIPVIGVDARVEPTGVDGSNAMALPEDVASVGWYRYGPAPGSDEGAAVLSGHVDSKTQGRGAMYRLQELTVGDPITVTRTGSGQIDYRVVAKERIVKQRLPVERLFARDGSPRLVLITCGGPFIPELSSYQDNVVVVAEPLP